MKGIPKDPRSTQRRRARSALFKARVPYWCNDCGHGPKILPKDFPVGKIELPPRSLRDKNQLQANHINKDIMDCDLVNLEWLCPSCHRIKDNMTGKGVSIKTDEWGYGIEDIM